MKKILKVVLAFLVKKVLKKYRPKIIGITGSIGKTSTKEAIYTVLKHKFSVRKTEGNYNNEIGLPLTILGEKSPGKSIFGWVKIFFRFIALCKKKINDYPQVLILEMGADKPGDIDYLTKLAPCDIGVVTKIAPAHIEFFGTLEKIAQEKKKIVTHMGENGRAILNFDDPRVRQMAKNLSAPVISFGYVDDADVRALDLLNEKQGADMGIQFKLFYRGSTVPMFLPGVIGEHQIYSALAACAVGLSLGMNLVDIGQALREYRAPKGRMNLILGKKNSLLVDDTYNSSPEAAMAAVEAVSKLNSDLRKVAFLGDMLELGDLASEAHYDLGKKVAQSGFSCLVAVGRFRQDLIQGAKQAGLNNLYEFENSQLAVLQALDVINNNDIVLIKGSQGSRMEFVTRALMNDPLQAKDLLVRQTGLWEDK